MRKQNLKSPLLFLLESILVGKYLPLQRCFIEWFVRDRRILEYDGDAIVPTPVFGHVITGLVHPHLQQSTHFDFLLEEWIVVFLKELQELLGITPSGFVVVLGNEGLVGRRVLGRSTGTYHDHDENHECEWVSHDRPPLRGICFYTEARERSKGTSSITRNRKPGGSATGIL